MSVPFEPRQTPFTGAKIDRAGELRHDSEQIGALLARRDARTIAVDSANVAVDGGGSRLARTAWHGDPSTAVLLGIEDGAPLLVVDLEDGEPDLGGTPRTISLREAGMVLHPAEAGLAAYAVALLNWHRRHRFCSVCGNATQVREGGMSRRCPNCGASHFPRTDPVVIMTVECDGRLLMGSRNGWDPTRYSVLAGFVSPGETPEEAVIREVREESGIVARDAVYVTAQPWPFPASLMLGFHAVADGGDPEPGGDDELSDVRWFSREELLVMQRGDSDLQLPGSVSIARLLIDRWIAGA